MSKKLNKKTLIIVLIVIAVIGAVVAVVVNQSTKLTNESYENCALGDINGDGYINSNDSLIVNNFSAKKIELFETQQKNADVNLDSKVDSTDAEIILQYAVGELRKLPYKEGDSENAGISDNEKLVHSLTDKTDSMVQVVNLWDNGDGTYSYQLNISIKNLSDSRLRGWKTTINLSADAKESKSWDCECEVEGKVITIEGNSIPSETAGVCGVIITAQQGLKLESIATEF